jgi:hypothetical protein
MRCMRSSAAWFMLDKPKIEIREKSLEQIVSLWEKTQQEMHGELSEKWLDTRAKIMAAVSKPKVIDEVRLTRI